MSRAKIEYDDYKVKAFLDANIILEGQRLTDLPWDEIDSDGPIIALITPTAMKEVDSKKQDGRIGKRAREFNRLIASVAAGGPPIIIRESKPRVELALSRAARIPWDQLDDLDPTDGDSCIVAEALHAKEMNLDGKMIVSHDIKPIAFASAYDLDTLHVSDKWLRPPEPSPHDKEIQRLKARVSEFEAKEPTFNITIEIIDPEPVPVVRIMDLTDTERAQIESKIVANNPQINQGRGLSTRLGYDSSYEDRYKTYRRQVPIFMENYAQRLERLFNQVRFIIRVENVGKVQAENLVLEVTTSSGWLHDRFVWVSPGGPTCPQPRADYLSLGPSRFPISPALSVLGRHEFGFKDKPDWGPSFSVTCQDFRHEETWAYEAILGIDPRLTEPTITVAATAGNFRGKERKQMIVQRRLETLHISQVIDLDSLRFARPTPIDDLLNQRDLDEFFDWKAFSVDDGGE